MQFKVFSMGKESTAYCISMEQKETFNLEMYLEKCIRNSNDKRQKHI